MIVDAFGKIEVTNEKTVTEVKTDKDLSSMVYDNLSMKSGGVKKFDSQSRFNDGSSIHTFGTGWY